MALRIASRAPVKASTENSLLRKEPTWGDVVRLQNIVAVLSPTNGAHLVTVLGSISAGPLHLQTVRNAAAHRNHQTLSAVNALRPYYIATRIGHPAEAALWSDPTTKDYAVLGWIEEMRIIADLMTA